MLMRKVAVSALLFALLAIWGGIWNHRLSIQRTGETDKSVPPILYSSDSTATAQSLPPYSPYNPREYIRIVRTR